jgi:hypothetical protein
MYAESVYLDVAYIAMLIHICCKHMFQMFRLFQTYITERSSYCKCFISRLRKRVQAETVPVTASCPHMCTGSEVGTGGPYGAARAHSSWRAGATTSRWVSSIVRAGASV